MKPKISRPGRDPASRAEHHDVAIRQVAHALADAQDPRSLLQSIAETAQSIVGAAGTYVEHLSGETQTVLIVAAAGRGVPAAGTRVPYPGSLTQERVEHHTDHGPELISDLTEQGRPIGRILRETCGPCAAMTIPLRSADELYGVLVLLRPRSEPTFTSDDITRLQLVADMASIAFKRARLIEVLRTDQERLRRGELRARLMADIGRVLGASLDHEETLHNAVRQIVPVFADWCTIDILEPKGTGIRRIALSHDDPAQESFAAELERRYAPTTGQDLAVTEVIRTGEPKLWREIPPDLLARNARDEQHARIVAPLGLESGILVPIIAHHKTFGAITIISSNPAKRYDEADLQFAMAFGECAGVAIENARLHAAAIESARRLHETVDRIGDAFYAFDRDWRLTYANPAADRMLKQFLGTGARDLTGKNLWHTVPQVIGTPMDHALRESMERQRPTHVEQFWVTGHAWIETFVYPSSDGVSVFARDVSERRRSQSAVAVLADVGARIAAATDYADTLQEVVRAVVPSFADYCVIDLAVDGFERSAYAHRTPAGEAILQKLLDFPPRPEDRLGEPYRTGTPLLISEVRPADLDSIAQAPEHRAATEELGPRSLIVAPLIARARTLGVMILARTSASNQPYSTADLDLAVELGRRAGNAVEKARLQSDLERAVRARDDMLAVVAHDLRNPIATIAMSASLMQELKLSDADRDKQVGIIRRGTERANRLIADLLDVAQIEAGTLALVRHSVDTDALMREVCELFEKLAAERHLVFECRLGEHLPPVLADHDRVIQVFSNLLGNAIKFVPDGGRVRVTPEVHPGDVSFAVTDTGRGIPANALSHVFDRYWQAKRGRGGAGLGLAIAKGIVEAHGGRISVDSTPGVGTTFVFTLPRA